MLLANSCPDYVRFLSEDFEQRRKRNPSFSLRAYARFLGIDPGALSRILARKQSLSLKSGSNLIKKLQISPTEKNLLLASLVEERRNRAQSFLAQEMDFSMVPQERQVQGEPRSMAARLAFMSKVTRVLLESVGQKNPLLQVPQLMVPDFADYCVVDWFEENKKLETMSIFRADKAHQRKYASQNVDCLDRLFQSGEAELHLGPITDECLRSIAHDESHLLMLKEAALNSIIVAPLIARGKSFGLVTFGLSGSSKTYSPADARFAMELAELAAMALDNAQLFQESQKAVRSRDELLAVVSHDLKNPLSAVLAQASILKRGSFGLQSMQVFQTGLENICNWTHKMADFVDDLLDSGRADSGHWTLRLQESQAESLVTAAAQMLEPIAAGSSVSLEVQVDPAIQVPLRCDPERILQVFSNLIGNAVKFTPPGGAVRVEMSKSDEEIRFHVIDTGPGIEEKHLRHIFNRYWRLQKTPGKNGMGLGLWIAKGIIEAHAGRIWAESQLGRGSTFSFALPLRQFDTKSSEVA